MGGRLADTQPEHRLGSRAGGLPDQAGLQSGADTGAELVGG